ncbi:helix-turn-helix transcriptional regulator [Allokutzneria albata]|uniref:Helix-turn-helix domain-containing protein n=1 Tax=Allokutzneria albata TaxID=211114 RepID=A0A1H0CLV4_ALLAB|nr:helix-turn-helix domain-containing protein [Allokutzneria albata]SDN58833.1 Helix-turn-helix domain-containing protein [Allokutzneria albata]
MNVREIEPLWGVEEVSAYLGVPVHTIRGWRSKNYGPPARKVGKHLRWDPIEVRRWFGRLGQEAA